MIPIPMLSFNLLYGNHKFLYDHFVSPVPLILYTYLLTNLLLSHSTLLSQTIPILSEKEELQGYNEVNPTDDNMHNQGWQFGPKISLQVYWEFLLC